MGVLYTLPGIFANAWFPSSQTATAFATTFVGFNCGGAISAVVFSFEYPAENQNKSCNGKPCMEDITSLYSTLFATSTASLLCVTAMFFCLAKDRPPSPPSEAEALLSNTHVNQPQFDFKSGLLASLKLFLNRPFVLLTLGNFLNTSAVVLIIALMPSLIAVKFPRKGILKIISYVNLSGFIGATGVSLTMSRILDRTKWFKGICCGGELLYRLTKGGDQKGEIS